MNNREAYINSSPRVPKKFSAMRFSGIWNTLQNRVLRWGKHRIWILYHRDDFVLAGRIIGTVGQVRRAIRRRC